LKDLKDDADQERKRLVAILARNKWQVAASARQIGVSRATFYRWMSRHQIVQPNRIASGE
jgi:transcriptional regulator of acetoin/glycerol metabolism